MLARPAPHAFTPGAPARIAVAADGATAAILEPRRVVAVGLPDCSVLTEVAVDDAAACELAWLGTRLLVLTRDATHTRAQLVDPGEGRTVADIRLEAPVRLVAAVGTHALVAGAPGTAVLTAGEAHLTPYQFPSRAQPSAGGAAGAMFVVALPGAIEEWDPASRTPKRRLRLPRPAAITALGGTDRVVWMTTQQEPARVDVIPLVNRGQPRAHELPEPLAAVHGHPRADYLLCVGAETGRLYGVDLEGRARLRTIVVEGLDPLERGAPIAAALVLGRGLAVIAAQAGRPLALLTLDGREHEPLRVAPASAVAAEPARSSLYDDPEPAPVAAPVAAPAAIAAPAVLPPRAEPAEPAPAIATPAFEDVPPEPAPPRPRVAWATGAGSLRERLRGREEAPTTRAMWRDDAALWADAVRGGTFDRAAPQAPPVEALAARFELPKALVPALVLLYGAHLAGHHGVAPVAVSRVLGRTWDEALGRGQLAALGLARYERSRVILAEPLQRVLDELPPGAGVLVGSLGDSSLLGACAVIAEPDEPLAMIAARLAPRLGGAILAALDDADPASVLLEARARGATPLVRHPAPIAPERPALVVVAHEGLAEQLGLPVLA